MKRIIFISFILFLLGTFGCDKFKGEAFLYEIKMKNCSRQNLSNIVDRSISDGTISKMSLMPQCQNIEKYRHTKSEKDFLILTKLSDCSAEIGFIYQFQVGHIKSFEKSPCENISSDTCSEIKEDGKSILKEVFGNQSVITLKSKLEARDIKGYCK